jgi:hypothetical protein
MTDITIPDEVVEAAAKAAHDQWRHEWAVRVNEPVENWREWEDLILAEQLGWIEQARAALRAGLAAWPGKTQIHHPREQQHALILPLPQEKQP